MGADVHRKEIPFRKVRMRKIVTRDFTGSQISFGFTRCKGGQARALTPVVCLINNALNIHYLFIDQRVRVRENTDKAREGKTGVTLLQF